MIPMWKLQRELKRFSQQLNAILERFWEPRAQKKHDRLFDEGFPTQNGECDQRPKIALLLIYQPDGLSKSTIACCEHLVDCGYSPLVVSNSELGCDELERLKKTTWKVVIRPNFGYDFGGYRDGMKLIWSWGIPVESLLILNDSIWFPLNTNETLLETLFQLDVDVAGTILRHRKTEKFLESYCYALSKRAFESTQLRDYWNRLRLTSNKYKVIRRGERGFSSAVIDAGLTIAGVYTPEEFKSRLFAKNDEFLVKTLRYGASHEKIVEDQRIALLNSDLGSAEWRLEVKNYVRLALEKGQIYSSFPYAMAHLFDYPILKKSNDRVARAWRHEYMSAVEAGEIPAPTSVILDELSSKLHADSGSLRL